MADFTALRWIVCPVVSPCTSNEGVDYDSLQENLARLLRAPITGFYVCGGTGDGSRLTFAERCRTAELTIAQTRAAGRRTIVHVGQTLQRHALELAEHAMTLGADAVASVPPPGGGRRWRTWPRARGGWWWARMRSSAAPCGIAAWACA